LLIDAPEPLWRSRREPQAVSVASSEGGTIERWVLSDTRLYLELAESGTSAVQRFVRSPSGTRTLVMLNPALGDLTIVLRQHALEVLKSTPPTTDHVLFSVTLPSVAPWMLENI
jgi:hypothetical protein